MEKQIQRFMPSTKELEGLDSLISNIPELQDMIEESDYSLTKIIEGINTLKMPDEYKTGLKQLFVGLQKAYVSEQIYKYSNFKNQDIIEQLFKREEQYQKIIKEQASKHSDITGIEDMNKMFSSIIITPKDNKKVSSYTTKTIKDIKTYKDFKPIFTQPGEKSYKKEELIYMKSSNNKGPRFNNVDSITVNNTNQDIDVKIKKIKN